MNGRTEGFAFVCGAMNALRAVGCVPIGMHHGQAITVVVLLEPKPNHLEWLNASLRLP